MADFRLFHGGHKFFDLVDAYGCAMKDVHGDHDAEDGVAEFAKQTTPPVQVGVSGLKGPQNLGTKREEVLRGWQVNERVWSGTRVPIEREWQRSAGAE